MDSFPIWNCLVFLVFTFFTVISGRFGYLIARRAGLPGWMGGAFGVPVIGLISMWLVGFKHWPALARKDG